MSCFCIEGNYDFKVEAFDNKRFFYTDLSDWMLEEPYIIPDRHRINIIPPGVTKKYEVYVEPLSTTVILPEQLGCPILSDGIYCFIVEPKDLESGGCGIKYKRTVGMFPNLECCLMQAFSVLGDEHYEELKNVEKALTMAKNAVELEKIQEAMDMFKIAKKTIR